MPTVVTGVIGYNECMTYVDEIVRQIRASQWPVDTLAALSRGGFPVAAMLAEELEIGGKDMFGLSAYRTEDDGDYVLGDLVHLGDMTGRHVLVVDDATVRGLLVRNAAEAIRAKGGDARTCALVASRRQSKPDFVATIRHPLPKFFWEV